MKLRRKALIVATMGAWLFLGSLGRAQQPNAVPADATPSADDDTLHEQTIYIPYDKLKRVFEKQGRGVFLPYDEFQKLWQAARKAARPTPLVKQPVDALISQIDSEATIADQVVNVVATLKIEVLGDNWVVVPLRLPNAAIRSATIDGKPARVMFDPKAGFKLLHHKTGKEAQEIELHLEYSRAYTKTPGQSSVTFEPPQAPINQWKIIVPETGITVNVEPMIAATRTPGTKQDKPAEHTELLAFVGAAPSVKITWNPKAEGASGLTAFATLNAQQQVVVSEGVMRTTVLLNYEISRSTLTQLVLDVPADQKVVNVYDRNVKRWQVVAGEPKQQRIEVELFEATRGQQTLTIELEQFQKARDAAREISVPVVTAVGVGRQQGMVVARLDAGLRGEAIRRVGLLQLDQDDLPATLRKTTWGFAYRYGAVPYELALRVEKVQPRVSATELVEASLSSDRLELDWQALYQIEDAGVFQLRVDLPDGFEVREIQGKRIGKSAVAAVDSYHRVTPDGPTWLVNLAKKAIGSVGLSVRMRRTLDDPNLLTPTGKASVVPIPLIRATSDDLEFSRGTLVFKSPESLRVNPEKTEGMRSISFNEAYQTVPAMPVQDKLIRPVLAYAFTKGPATLSVNVERRRPQVTVRQLLQTEVEAGVVKYKAAFYFDIKYSGVKSLRIDVPADLADAIRNITKSPRRSVMSPQPDDVADGYVAWSFAGEAELLGRVAIQLAWEQKIDELKVGTSREIKLPQLVPQSVDRANGQIVISKSESIDVQPTGKPEGLRPIDPQHDLMPEAKVKEAAMAFEFVGDWKLSIEARRYEAAPGKQTAVERSVVRIVALTQGELSVQALYRIRSSQQRLAIQLPEKAEFDAQPLRINGAPVTPEQDSATTIFAPLVDRPDDEPFLLELRYSVAGEPSRLDLPVFPDGAAVEKVYLCVYLPRKILTLKQSGPWSNEQEFDWSTMRSAAGAGSDSALLKWVSENVAAGLNSAQAFPVGQTRLHIYSTLRPAQPPDGSLRLRTMNRNVFNGCVLLVLALVGLPFLKRSIRSQVAVLLFIAIAVLLIGVFIPEAGMAILFGIFPIAVCLLVLLWLIGHVLSFRLRRATVSAAPRGPDETGSPFQPQGGDEGEPVTVGSDAASPDSTPPDGASSAADDLDDGNDNVASKDDTPARDDQEGQDHA